MRGKARRQAQSVAYLGITPAYAGKSDVIASTFGTIQDHPRLCGEKVLASVRHLSAAGSPPPMRGKADNFALQTHDKGITPAYAGKSKDRLVTASGKSDHPRLCGEKCLHMVYTHSMRGSPPPMRGKDKNDDFGVQQIGITPAYAGKSGLQDVLPVPAEDHPRLCGEKLPTLRRKSKHRGSPPPMRGKGPEIVLITTI